MRRAEVLNAAAQAVADRGLNYGSPEDNFLRIARLWNAHLRNKGLLAYSYGVDETDVALMLAAVKMARLANDASHADSWIDIAGYAACGAECAEPKQRAVDTITYLNTSDRSKSPETIPLSSTDIAAMREKGEETVADGVYSFSNSGRGAPSRNVNAEGLQKFPADLPQMARQK